MEKATFKEINPVLPSRDVRRSVQFYANRLGFRLEFQDSADEPRYVGLRRDDVELHVQWHDPAEWKTVERPSLRFVVSAVDSLFAEYREQGIFHAGTALRETPWGTREFAFYDPDQNGLTFYMDLERD